MTSQGVLQLLEYPKREENESIPEIVHASTEKQQRKQCAMD